MKKQKYEAPMIQKVSLDVNSAVLSVCHSSNINDSNIPPTGCRDVDAPCSIGAPLGPVNQFNP